MQCWLWLGSACTRRRALLPAQLSEGSCTQLGSHGPLQLPGWGMEAVLKNTGAAWGSCREAATVFTAHPAAATAAEYGVLG